MKWRKPTVALIAVASVPVVALVGAMIAHLVFMRLAFQGYEVGELSSEGIGSVFLTWIFCGALVLLDAIFWIRIYRRVSN
jgi:hypothetical protein